MNLFGTLILASFTTCLIGSCSKGPHPVAVISLEYSNVNPSFSLYSIRTNPGNINDVIDTVFIQEMTNPDVKIEVEKNQFNYVLFTSDGQFRDTVTAIHFDRVGSKQKIENFTFLFNGVSKTGEETIVVN